MLHQTTRVGGGQMVTDASPADPEELEAGLQTVDCMQHYLLSARSDQCLAGKGI